MTFNKEAWDRIRSENATYYIWREARNTKVFYKNDGIFVKEILSSNKDAAIESFVQRCNSDHNQEHFQKSVLMDKTGMIIKIMPEDNALVGTFPFNEISWNGVESLKHLPAVEHAWRHFNNQPYYKEDHVYA